MRKTFSAVMLLLCLTEAQAVELNDTGLKPNQWLTGGFDLITNNYSGINPAQFYAKNQDPKYGRDAAQGRGALLKVGGGDAGFDFTRICGNGDEEGSGTCPSSLTANDIGMGSTQWACTRDNVTGRTWELKTNDGGLQDVDWEYSWYSTDANSNGGDVGVQMPTSNPGQCGSHLANCNTEEFVAALNALNDGAGLCGFTDWRLPFHEDIASIVHYGVVDPNVWEAPQIDLNYFPNIKAVREENHDYWSATVVAEDPASAWALQFHWRFSPRLPKGSDRFVMLVRGEDANEPPALASSPSTVESVDCINENPAIPSFTPTSDFTLNEDGTATHHKTGLIWDRCVLGGINSTECIASDGGINWPDTLNFISNVNANMHRGHNDWRMPNIKELLSIVEYRCWAPAFNTTVFPIFGQYSGSAFDFPLLWSSTISVTNIGGGAPHTIDTENGLRDGQNGQLSPLKTLLVRGGRPLHSFDDQFPSWLLSVTKAGIGSGTFIDTEGSCTGIEDAENKGDCLVVPGSNVSLQAVADPGSFFVGWSGALGSVPTNCNGTVEDCAINAIAASGNVTATFQLLPPLIFDDGFETETGL